LGDPVNEARYPSLDLLPRVFWVLGWVYKIHLFPNLAQKITGTAIQLEVDEGREFASFLLLVKASFLR
jgi:hypothetical protein